MAFLSMRHDFRAPAFAPESSQQIYAAALEQFAWADEHGFDSLVVSEHHGVDDGWMPAPLTIAAAVLARSSRARLMISASILPLHDPIRIAEQIAVLDNAFPGRMWIVFGAGYRAVEFEMAGLEHAARGRILEEQVQTVLDALSGEPFEWRGREVRVTPKPVTDPRRMLFVGGGVPAAARRAARLRLAMFPMNTDAEVRDAYYDEAAKIGFEGGFLLAPVGPTFVHVADDPDRAWAEIGKYVLVRSADLRVVPDAGSTLDAGRARDVGRRPQGIAAVRRGNARRGRSPGCKKSRARVASSSTRSRAGCRRSWRGRASSCSRRRSCRDCGEARL